MVAVARIRCIGIRWKRLSIILSMKEDLRAPWDFAGMTHDNGRLLADRLPAGTLVVPSWIELDEGQERLLWSWHRTYPPYTQVRPDSRVLEGFVKLADAPAEKVLDYARRFGVLGICEHGVPASHNRGPFPPQLGPQTACRPLGYFDFLDRDRSEGLAARACWEPVEVWWRFARQARAMLDIAAHLHQDQRPRAESWRTLWASSLGWTEGEPEPWKDWDSEDARRELADPLNMWLALGVAPPLLRWEGSGPPAVLLGGGLFGTLAVQLMSAVTRTRGLSLCSECGDPYPPERQPRAGEKNYCQECRSQGKPGLNATKAYQRRKRAGNAS